MNLHHSAQGISICSVKAPSILSARAEPGGGFGMPTGVSALERPTGPCTLRNYAASAMSAKYIIAGLAASFAIAYASDVLVAQKKVFGGKGSSVN